VYRIAEEPIDVAELEASLRTREGAYGGVATFVGIVRSDATDGAPVTGLFYEAYDTMALREFERIADEARQRFGAVKLAIAHRRGWVEVGEVAVAVIAAAAHRAEALDACRLAIDRLKERAPIWKREERADGTRRWRANA
jgi:molybdopterin synthase catalytic subunit